MPNIKIQDLVATINGTSRYGAKYDTVHVETFISTDSPIPPEMSWYVPNGASIPKEILPLFNLTHVDMYPQTEADILKGTEDILQECKEESKTMETISDASKIILRSIMTKGSPKLIEGTQNYYSISYDYKLYPNDDNSFEFKVELPFAGLTMINGTSLVQTTITCPINSKVDSVKSFGLDLKTNTEVTQETVAQTPTKRPIVTFQYKQDPIFVINYSYSA